MLRLLGIFAILGVLATAAYGSAATLGVEGATVQTGSDSTLYCDTDGVTVDSYGLNDHLDPMNVPSVTVTGISPNCAGARIGLRVDAADGTMLAASAAPAGAAYACHQWVTAVPGTDSYVFNLVNPADRTQAIQVDASKIERIQIWMEGYDASCDHIS